MQGSLCYYILMTEVKSVIGDTTACITKRSTSGLLDEILKVSYKVFTNMQP